MGIVIMMKIMIIEWNKWATCNVVKTSHWIFMTQGTSLMASLCIMH